MSMKAMLFDLDNTLMDRDHTFREFAKQLVGEHCETAEAGRKEALIHYMIETDRDGYRPKDGFFAELLENLPWREPMNMDKLKAYYDEHYMSHAQAMRYSKECLQHIRSCGIKTGLITNGFTHLQNSKIDTLGLRQWLDVIVISEEAGIRKPDPGIYELALAKLGTTAAETVIIGDHPVNDIWGAAKLGIKGLWLKRKHDWPNDLDEEPLALIHELDEVAAVLEALLENSTK